MKRFILRCCTPLALCLPAVLCATEAAAAEDRVHVYGPIPYGADGDYVQTGETYEGHPVYVLETDATWHLYRRLDGVWYIDFNDIDEQWSGTVATGPNADTPFDGAWDASDQGAIPSDVLTVVDAPYSGMTTGTYAFSGQTYNGKPVFDFASSGYTFSVYQRADGQWYLDFDDINEQWAGTLAFTTSAVDWPWQGTWSGSTVMTPVEEIDVANAPYSGMTTGTYVFSGQTYNGKPVFDFASSGYTFSVYQRADGKWYLDYDDVDEQWAGTLAFTTSAVDMPWESSFNGSTTVEAVEN